jgi:hypothetical protein
MSGLSATVNPTYIDLMKSLTPDGDGIMPVAEILNETNDGLLEYLSFVEGNLPTGHKHAMRTGLPTVSRGRINKGVVATKGTTVEVVDNCAELESLSEVTAKLLDMAPDPGSFRLQQDRPHIEAMNQQFFQDLWYGDETVDPDAFTGLMPRYNDPDANNADNLLDGSGGVNVSGATDLRSMWLICWSPNTCTGIIPKRTQPNLQQEDLGMRWLDDDGSNTGARIKVYGTYFRWFTGLAVPDWRYVVRICNISPSNMKDDASSGLNLPFIMKDAMERLPSFSAGRCAFYTSREVIQLLRKQVAAGVDQSTLTMENVGGTTPRQQYVFDNFAPVFRTDSLAVNETHVDFS